MWTKQYRYSANFQKSLQNRGFWGAEQTAPDLTVVKLRQSNPTSQQRTAAIKHPVKGQRGMEGVAGSRARLWSCRTLWWKRKPQEDACLCARRVRGQPPAWAPRCRYLVVENITCLAPYYLYSALKSGTLINYCSKVLIKHQSKAGLLGWGLPWFID